MAAIAHFTLSDPFGPGAHQMLAETKRVMVDLVSSIFVLALLVGYSALLIGLLVWMLHGWVGSRVKPKASRSPFPRVRFLRLFQRD